MGNTRGEKKFDRGIRCIMMALLLAAGVSCSAMDKKQKGALAGAIVGGSVGGASKGGRGALIGAAAGAAAGGLAGAYLDQRQKELSRVVETEKTVNGLKITLKNDVLFDFGKTELKDASKSTLGELAQILAKYPKDQLQVAGYTDHIGGVLYNQRLSAARAEVVKNYLASNGVRNPMESIGHGEIAGTGNDPAAVAMNRKVEIYVDVEPPQNNEGVRR